MLVHTYTETNNHFNWQVFSLQRCGHAVDICTSLARRGCMQHIKTETVT